MILHNLQKLLVLHPALVITTAYMSDGRFICHVVKDGRIIAKGISITLDRAIEKALIDFAEYQKPDLRQTTLEM